MQTGHGTFVTMAEQYRHYPDRLADCFAQLAFLSGGWPRQYVIDHHIAVTGVAHPERPPPTRMDTATVSASIASFDFLYLGELARRQGSYDRAFKMVNQALELQRTYRRGTITPLGSGLPAILDRGLLGHAEISLGSGVEGWAIHLDPADLVEAFDVTIGDVARS